jgi:hypothetical protein
LRRIAVLRRITGARLIQLVIVAQPARSVRAEEQRARARQRQGIGLVRRGVDAARHGLGLAELSLAEIGRAPQVEAVADAGAIAREVERVRAERGA